MSAQFPGDLLGMVQNLQRSKGRICQLPDNQSLLHRSNHSLALRDPQHHHMLTIRIISSGSARHTFFCHHHSLSSNNSNPTHSQPNSPQTTPYPRGPQHSRPTSSPPHLNPKRNPKESRRLQSPIPKGAIRSDPSIKPTSFRSLYCPATST
jgi:hypothetical protein